MLENRSTAFCKTFDCFIRIPVLNAIPDTVANMPLQNHLSASVKRRFGSIDLSKNILTGDIFIYHSVNRLNLTNDFLESAVQIIRIHALSHNSRLHTIRVYVKYIELAVYCQSAAGSEGV